MLLILKLPFQRVIHEIAQEQVGQGRNIRFNINALMALQEEGVNLCPMQT